MPVLLSIMQKKEWEGAGGAGVGGRRLREGRGGGGGGCVGEEAAGVGRGGGWVGGWGCPSTKKGRLRREPKRNNTVGRTT